MSRRTIAAASCWLAVVAMPAVAGEVPVPELVRDVNPARPVFDPDSPYGWAGLGLFESLGRTAVFVASEPGASACVLWRTDGTDAGTAGLADLCRPDQPEHSAVGILAHLGPLAFISDSERRLWRTDGTPAGTFPLGEVRLPEARFGSWLVDPAGSKLLFSGCTPDAGCELWASDGTPDGTLRVADLVPGPESGDPGAFAAAGGRVLFVAGAGRPTSLWTTDGTAEGTRQLTALGDASGVEQIVPFGRKLLLRSSRFADFHVTRDSLWEWDEGSAALRLLIQFDCYSFFSCSDLRFAGSDLFLARWDPDDEGALILGLWRTDGTPGGTRRIELPRLAVSGPFMAAVGSRVVLAASADGAPLSYWTIARGADHAEPLAGCPGGCPDGGDSPERLLAVHDGVLYLAGSEPTHGLELWRSDGTGPGTRLVADLCPGPCDSAPHAGRSVGGALLFISRDHLWRTDGSARGTAELAGLRPLAEGIGRAALDLAAAGDGIVFEGFDEAYGIQLWGSDLTPRGSRPVTAISSLGGSSRPNGMTAVAERVVFAACDEAAAGLWASDGTEAGTAQLPGTTAPCEFPPGIRWTAAAGVVFGTWQGRLWRSDGTAAGTFPVGPLLEPSPRFVRGPVALGSRLLFLVDPPPDQPRPLAWEVWSSDGTEAGTQPRFSLTLGGTPDEFASTGQEVFFIAQAAEPPYSYALWRTDGTEAGTRPILEVEGDLFELPLARLGGTTYLLTRGAGRDWGPELWRTDGTAAGTAPVLPPPGPAGPHQATALFAWGDALYFLARVGADGPLGLWRSDGTAGGTTLLRGFAPPPYEGPPPPLFTSFGDRLYFRADDGAHGSELWSTDGTVAGTELVVDLRPGPASSQLSGLVAAAGRLYFAANDGTHGVELWTSDGAAAGTRLAADVWPGALSSAPEQLTALGPWLLFTADDGIHGREPWRLPLASGPCEPSAQALCLLDGRVQAEAFWRRGTGPWRSAVRGSALGASDETGVFALLPGPGADVAVRLAELPGGTAAYVAGLSTLEWALVLTDTSTGARRRYLNVGGRLGSLFDAEALAAGPDGADRVLPASEPLPARALFRRQAAACRPGPRALCLLDRFAVEAVWHRPGGPPRAARAQALDAASGTLAVYGPEKAGMVVKAVDGRVVNGHFWFFAGSLTGFEVTVTVTDTLTGARRSYLKPEGESLSFADVAAF